MNKLKIFVEGKTFQNFILGIIIFNSLLLGLMTIKNLNETFYNVLTYIDITCLIIYIIEMLLKLIAYNVIGYFKNFWNCFDFVIIVCSILSEFTSLSSIKIMRSLRIFRSLRSLRGLKALKSINYVFIVLTALRESLPGIFWTLILVLILLYVYGVIGVIEFGDNYPEWFGTLPKAMYSLFEIMNYDGPDIEDSYSWIYFYSFLFLSNYIVFNVTIGIIIYSVYVALKNNNNDNKEISKNDDIDLKLESVIDHLDNLDNLIKNGKFVQI